MIKISVDSVLQTFEPVSELIQQFTDYQEMFSPVFLQYNGETKNISLQYRLRTFQSFMDRNEYIVQLITQYIKNPIKIPSNLYKVRIFGQKSTKDYAKDQNFLHEKDGIILFDLNRLFKLDSEFITIIIDSSFHLDLNSLIKTQISAQPILLDKQTFQYEILSMLKTNQFPDYNFQCLNIPVALEITVNDLIEYYIPRKFLLALKEWEKIERAKSGFNRKENEISRMFRYKYGITPFEFLNRMNDIVNDILPYVQKNYDDVVKIQTIKGELIPEVPKGYQRTGKPRSNFILFEFKTHFDSRNCGTKAKITFNFKWLKKLMKKYFYL
ncbi:MAG: hypothetical protein ACTSVI_10385 [Promethearchaeota archaeon]